jgi:hypothetical protein
VIDFWRKKGNEEQEVGYRFFWGRDEEPEATNASLLQEEMTESRVMRAVFHLLLPVLLRVERHQKLGWWRRKRVQGWEVVELLEGCMLAEEVVLGVLASKA